MSTPTSLPSIWQYALSGNRSPSILVTCPNHASRRFLIFWTSDSSWCNILRTISFLILYLLVTHNNLLNQAISALRILHSSFFKHQRSDPYTSTEVGAQSRKRQPEQVWLLSASWSSWQTEPRAHLAADSSRYEDRLRRIRAVTDDVWNDDIGIVDADREQRHQSFIFIIKSYRVQT